MYLKIIKQGFYREKINNDKAISILVKLLTIEKSRNISI